MKDFITKNKRLGKRENTYAIKALLLIAILFLTLSIAYGVSLRLDTYAKDTCERWGDCELFN